MSNDWPMIFSSLNTLLETGPCWMAARVAAPVAATKVPWKARTS